MSEDEGGETLPLDVSFSTRGTLVVTPEEQNLALVEDSLAQRNTRIRRGSPGLSRPKKSGRYQVEQLYTEDTGQEGALVPLNPTIEEVQPRLLKSKTLAQKVNEKFSNRSYKLTLDLDNTQKVAWLTHETTKLGELVAEGKENLDVTSKPVVKTVVSAFIASKDGKKETEKAAFQVIDKAETNGEIQGAIDKVREITSSPRKISKNAVSSLAVRYMEGLNQRKEVKKAVNNCPVLNGLVKKEEREKFEQRRHDRAKRLNEELRLQGKPPMFFVSKRGSTESESTEDE